ncbi:LuxR C-terminal-related transcriptional regulator [Alteraurantiacibacter aquimixticola]|nr:response regulator transcription factor [Alteraurantiacibacter aquimixticola]
MMQSDHLRLPELTLGSREKPASHTVLIASEVALVSEGLSLQLTRTGTVQVLGHGKPDSAMLHRILELQPDAVILDFGSRSSGLLAEQLRQAQLSRRIVGVAIANGAIEVADWARLGVAGFVDNEGTVEDVITAIDLVARGEFSCSPRTAARLVSRLVCNNGPRANLLQRPHLGTETDLGRLTPRETEILFDLERGATNKEIARRLGVSVSTVKNHVHHVLEKLNVDRRQQAGALVRSVAD